MERKEETATCVKGILNGMTNGFFVRTDAFNTAIAIEQNIISKTLCMNHSNNAAKWQEETDQNCGKEAFRTQEEMYGSYKIVSSREDEGYAVNIYIQDPVYCKWHLWEKDDDRYPTRKAAVKVAKNFIDNYEPSQD